MAIEAAATIEDLDTSLPDGDDDLTELNEHLQLIKDVLKKQFPGVTTNGFNTPILTTETELNFLVNTTSNLQAQLDILTPKVVPIGGMMLYEGLLSAIPSSWQLADGTNGTINMNDLFPLGTNTEAEVGNLGGSASQVVVSHSHTMNHTHTGSVSTDGAHTHIFDNSTFQSSASGDYLVALQGTPNQNFLTQSGGSHNHAAVVNLANVTVVTTGNNGDNNPTYIKLSYIQRMT